MKITLEMPLATALKLRELAKAFASDKSPLAEAIRAELLRRGIDTKQIKIA